MPDKVTASVQCLTAEVRVLMVGSRQITQSVFSQLDDVGWHECIPMGRVSPREGGMWIIGASKYDGTLVRSSWEWERIPGLERGDAADLKRLQSPDGGRGYSRSEDQIKKDSARLAELLQKKAEQDALLVQWKIDRAAYDALPLIILAGLR